ncbi:hypothetical protein [Streptomyces sp. NPDC016172]
MVAGLDVAEPQVLAVGATLLDGPDKPVGYRVCADPVGSPSASSRHWGGQQSACGDDSHHVPVTLAATRVSGRRGSQGAAGVSG